MRLLLYVGLLTIWILSDAVADDVHRGKEDYERSVLPVLQEFCGNCHGKSTNDDRWAFDGYARYGDLVADQKLWGKAEQFLKSHLMPPRGKKSPSQEQRRQIVDWIDNVVFFVDPHQPDPGRTTLRRLNREEYNNSVRDVFGIDLRPADQFPPDDSGYGFDNIGDVLSLSPLHLEKYLSAAREVAAEITRLESPLHVGVELTADKLTVFAGTPQLENNVLLLRSPVDEVGTLLDVPVPSVYRVLARIAVAGGGEKHQPQIEVLCSGEKLTEFEPKTEWTGKVGFWPAISGFVELPAGQHRLSLRMKASTDEKQLAVVSFLEISGPFTPLPPQASEYLRQSLGARPLGVPILQLSGEDLNGGTGRSGLDTGRAWFASTGYRHAPLILPVAGKFRVRLKVGAQQVGDEQVRFEVRTAGQTLGPFTVTARSQVEQWIETECRLPAGEHDWQVWFLNEFKDAESGTERWFWLHEFSIEGPLDSVNSPQRDEVVDLLAQTGRRLFRRPLSAAESRKLAHLVDSAIASGQRPLAALGTGLEALLISPRFLYHPRPAPVGTEDNDTTLIDEFALASRLSYFLWSSTPDDELLSLAERGLLRTQFAAQVKRMLRDSKSRTLITSFARQWLQLRDLDNVAPDTEKFPEYDARLAADMRRESELLFEHILRENRSPFEFLDADFTFLNARLAAHYGLAAPEGDGFQRVSLAATPRRGVLTHGSVLTLTSHPTRTSPVKRGKWILEQILGTNPPPAPRNVPPLSDTRENENLTLRIQLEQHRANAACASCHALLDPMGFALENYDAIGRWRVKDGKNPIDTTGELVTGERFSDWSELRTLLVRSHREDFLRCLTENLFTFALGRGVTFKDKLVIREIVTRINLSGGGLQDLILAVSESPPFQRMRMEPKATNGTN